MTVFFKKYSRGNSPLMIILVIVVVAAIIGLIYWALTKGGVTFSPTPTPTPLVTTETPTPTKTPVATPTKSPTPTPVPKKLTITVGSNNALDGFESSNGGGNATLEVRAGRNSNLNTRGFLSFAVPSELSGKQVDKATLRIYQAQVIGNPYTALGKLLIDHLDYGTSLENADYAAASLSPSFATVTNNASLEYKDVDVKDMLIDDLANGRTYSQYRIHFENEAVGGTLTGDFAYFESQDNSMGTGKQPQLVIQYH